MEALRVGQSPQARKTMAKIKNYTQRAIEYAIAGGWEHGHLGPDFFQNKNFREWKKYTINHPDPQRFFLEPAFWKGLRNGLRAKEPRHYWHKTKDKDNMAKVTLVDWFENTMHSFVDHLLTGQTMEAFFRELIEHHTRKKVGS